MATPKAMAIMSWFLTAANNPRHQGRYHGSLQWVNIINNSRGGEGEVNLTEKQFCAAVKKWPLPYNTHLVNQANPEHEGLLVRCNQKLIKKPTKASKNCIPFLWVVRDMSNMEAVDKIDWQKRYEAGDLVDLDAMAARQETRRRTRSEGPEETPNRTPAPTHRTTRNSNRGTIAAAHDPAGGATPGSALPPARLINQFGTVANGGSSLNNSQGTDTSQGDSHTNVVTPPPDPQVPGLEDPSNQWIQDLFDQFQVEPKNPSEFSCKAFTDRVMEEGNRLKKHHWKEKYNKIDKAFKSEQYQAPTKAKGINALTKFNIPLESPAAMRDVVSGLIAYGKHTPEVLQMLPWNGTGLPKQLVLIQPSNKKNFRSQGCVSSSFQLISIDSAA